MEEISKRSKLLKYAMEDDRKTILDNMHVVPNNAGNPVNEEAKIMNNGRTCNAGGLNATLEVVPWCGIDTEGGRRCVAGPGVQNLPFGSLPTDLRKLPETDVESNEHDLIADSNPEDEHSSTSMCVRDALLKAERKCYAETLFDGETKAKVMKIEPVTENVGERCKKSAITSLDPDKMKKAMSLIRRVGREKAISIMKDMPEMKKVLNLINEVGKLKAISMMKNMSERLKGSTITGIRNGKDKFMKKEIARRKMLDGVSKPRMDVMKQALEGHVRKRKGSTIKGIGNGKDKFVKKEIARRKMLDGVSKPRMDVMKQALEAETGVKKQHAKSKKVVKKSTAFDEALMAKPEMAKRIVKNKTVDYEKALNKELEKVVTEEASRVEKASKKMPENAGNFYKQCIIEADKGVKKMVAKDKDVKKKFARSDDTHKLKLPQANRLVKKTGVEIALKKKPKKVVNNEVENSTEKSPGEAEKMLRITVTDIVKKMKKKSVATCNKDTEAATGDKTAANEHPPSRETVIKKRKVSVAKGLVKKRIIQAENLRENASKAAKAVKKREKTENVRGTQVAKVMKIEPVTENVEERCKKSATTALDDKEMKKLMNLIKKVGKNKAISMMKDMAERGKLKGSTIKGIGKISDKKKAAKPVSRARSKATEAKTVENEASTKMENVVRKKSIRAETVPEARKRALKSERVVEKKVVEGGTEVKGKDGKTKHVAKNKKSTVDYSECMETDKHILIRETANVKGVKRKAKEMEEKAKRPGINLKASLHGSIDEVKKANSTVVRPKQCKTLQLKLTAVEKPGGKSDGGGGALFKQLQQQLTDFESIIKNQTEKAVVKNSKVSLHPFEDAIKSRHVSLDNSSLSRDDVNENWLQVREIDNAGFKQKKVNLSALVSVNKTQETFVSEPSATKTRIHVEDSAIDESLQNSQNMQGNRVIGTVNTLSVGNQDCGSIVPVASSWLHDSPMETFGETNPETCKYLSDKEVCTFVRPRTDDESKAFLFDEAVECVDETQKPDNVSNLVWLSSEGKQTNSTNCSVIPVGANVSIVRDLLPQTNKTLDVLASIFTVGAPSSSTALQQASEPKKALQSQKHSRLDDIAEKLWKMKFGAGDTSNKKEAITEQQNQYDTIASELNIVVDKSVPVFSDHSYACKQSADGEAITPKQECDKTKPAADYLLKPTGTSEGCAMSDERWVSPTSEEHLNADAVKRFTTMAADHLNPATSVEGISSLPGDQLNAGVQTVAEEHASAVVSFENVTATPEMQFNAAKHVQGFSGTSERLAVTDSRAMSEEESNVVADSQNVMTTTEKQVKLITPVMSVTTMSENRLSDSVRSISYSKHIADLREKQLKAVSSKGVTVIPEHLNVAAHSQSVPTMSERELSVTAHSQSLAAMSKMQFEAVTPTQSVMSMPKEYLYDFTQPTGLMLLPDEKCGMEQQVYYNLMPDAGVDNFAQPQGITNALTTPVDYLTTFDPQHPGFSVVLQRDNCNCLHNEACSSIAQSRVGNSNILQLQNATLFPREVCYAVVQPQVGNINMFQLQNDTPKEMSHNVSQVKNINMFQLQNDTQKEMSHNVSQVKNSNMLQLQNDTFLPSKVCYTVAPSQVGNSNILPLQKDTFLSGNSHAKVCCLAEPSEDIREVLNDENVNHFQAETDTFSPEDVCYYVESSEDKGEMADVNVGHDLQSQNDALLAKKVCYLVESSDDEKELAEDERKFSQPHNDAFLSKEVCYLVESSDDESDVARVDENVNDLQSQSDACLSEEVCYLVEPSEFKRESENGNLLPLQNDAFMPEEVRCITSEFNNDLLMSQGNCCILMPTVKMGIRPLSDIYTGDTHFSAVKEVDVSGMMMPQSTLNLLEASSSGIVKQEKDKTEIVPNVFDVQEVNCSTVSPCEDVFYMPDIIGHCVEIESSSNEIMPENRSDDAAVALKKDGFVDGPSHDRVRGPSKRKMPKRQCKSLAAAKEKSKDVAQQMQLRSHLGLRVTPSKVKPFQFDHKQGEVVNAEEKSCETSKDSGDIVNKLLQALIKSNKKTINPKRHHSMGLQESDVAVLSKPSPPVSCRPGELVWARLSFQRFWPAIVVDPLSCGQSTTKPGCCWVFWFGDYKVSEVPLTKVLPFAKNFLTKYIKSERKTFETGVVEAIKELDDRANGMDGGAVKSSKDLIAWANSSFSTTCEVHKEWPVRLPNWILEKLEKIRLAQLELRDSDTETNGCRKKDASNVAKVTSNLLKDGQVIQSITDICIVCQCVLGSNRYEHPFFNGGLCPSCRETLLQSIFFFDSDGTNSYCIICGLGKEVFVCEAAGCNKVYCTDCIRRLAGESIVEAVRKTDEWRCFVCATYDPKKHGLLNGKREWRANLESLFQESPNDAFLDRALADRQPIRVLSLFDGIGTAKLVLDQLNIQIEKYFASEVEQDAITVAQIRHPGLIQHLGDVRNITTRTIEEIGPVDLLIGGSPCNELSIANPGRKGLEAGSGLLFFEFCRILWFLKNQKRDRPLFWIYENVASMNDESCTIISRMFACEPALWDAKYFSAQRRARYFWGNIPEMYCPLQYSATEACGNLDDNLFPTRKAKVQKVRTITTQRNSLLMDRNKEDSFPVTMGDAGDSLWIPEVERIFGFPEHYTDVANLSASKRLKLLGQSWSVPVIRRLLSPLCNYFLTTSNAAAEMLIDGAVARDSGDNVTTMSASNVNALPMQPVVPTSLMPV